MSGTIDWIGAAAEASQSQKPFTTEGTGKHGESQNPHFWQNRPEVGHPDSEGLDKGQNPHPVAEDATRVGYSLGSEFSESLESNPEDDADSEMSWEEKRERRIYRRRTIKMLRRYMRYSIETGRLPSLLRRQFFRAKVTAYIVVTFEDRVIFVHDMETCLNKLDKFSRRLIAGHILQEHDQVATARLLGCSERTVRRYTPIVLDMLREILLDVGLLERISPKPAKSCQEGERDEIFVSDCETSKKKFKSWPVYYS